MRRAKVTFPCGNISLEGAWHFPEGSVPFPVVIVCHPHPLYGGSMLNSVVFALCRSLAERSIAAFRFNFRGVGGSGGSFGEGTAEQEDIQAALTLVSAAAEVDLQRIGLAGYSFGGRVALSVTLQDVRVKRLALISPALTSEGLEQLRECAKPKFLMVGESDSVPPMQLLLPRVRGVLEPGQYEIVSGADHFWRGYEKELTQKMSGFFAEGFSQL